MVGPLSPRRLAGVVAAALPTAARRALRRRLGRRLDLAASGHGLVSVVVVCEGRDLVRLPTALASALGQSHRNLEVLVCPVGESSDAVAEVLAGLCDGRVRQLPTEPTWPRALDSGAARAGGDLLTFLRGCDLLTPDAVAVAARSLAESGSEVATARLDQAGAVEPWLDRAQRAVHGRPQRAVAIGERPDLAGSLALGGLVVRRSVWGGGPGADDDWVTSPTVARLLSRVARVDVLEHAAYTFAPGHGTRAFAATPSPLVDVSRWCVRVAEIEKAVAGTPLAQGWRRHVATIELPRLLMETERADESTWTALRDLATAYAGPGAAAAELPAGSRALVRLAADGRRGEVEALAAETVALGDDLVTRLLDAEARAVWRTVDLSADLTRLSEAETPLRTHVHRTRWLDCGREIDLFLELRHVDAAAGALEMDVRADCPVQLVAPPRVDAEATRWAGRRFQDAVAATVAVPGEAAVTLHVRLGVGGLARAVRVDLPARPGPPRTAPVVVSDLAMAGLDLVVTASGQLDAVRLLGPDDRPLDVGLSPIPGGVRVELCVETFGRPAPLASGPHRLVTPAGNVSVTEELRGRLPHDLVGERHRVRAHLGPLGGLVLGLTPPLAEDEAGPRAQERLQAAYAVEDRPLDPDLAYFDSYVGRSATDSPRAIHDELRRRRPGLRTVWGIVDHAQGVPDGAVPVLLRSREWYAALATASLIVTNTDVEAWLRRRPGQVLLQTFHGYPSKAMGLGQWHALGHAPNRIRIARARGVDTWSAIVTPTPEMTFHYREQYAYDGPAFEHGYPRNDDLVLPTAVATRDRTRALLGIGAHQCAVLYAPTWREHLAFRARGAAMTDFLDLDEAARALGGDHVLLVRGHRFHRPGPGSDGESDGGPDGGPDGGARVLDVTTYPEINDLVLASDAAVLDYSSLRFDYALTGKPMVFLVPDLADYDAGSRSFLFPFEESAPGPFVDDTAGVVAQLLDRDGLLSRHSVSIDAFNQTFNPWQDGRATERVVDQLLALL